jgi:hypothetical protein
VADSSALFGTLGQAPILELFKILAAKNVEAQQFGWGRPGAGGSYTLQQNYVGYFPHRAGSPAGLANFPFDGQIWYGNDMPEGCAWNDVMQYAHANVFCPFWFFDWCKQYLAILRAYQPKFDAPAGAKLVWVTHVAWVINAALSATNLHGSILPSAIYEHITGSPFDKWAGEGSYMYTAQHAAVFPQYWKDAWTQAANAILAKKSGDILLDSGYKVFNRQYEIKWESAWRGPLPVPMETARFRYDPPISVHEYNWRADEWKIQGLAGAHYNNTIENDPYVVRGSNGLYANDNGLAIRRYAMWSMFVPWVEFRAFDGIDYVMASGTDPQNKALLQLTLSLSTLFSPGAGTTRDYHFWNVLSQWYTATHKAPALIQTGLLSNLQVSFSKGAKVSLVPIYGPNYELAFRYFYPAMIDTILACDFYSLINTGVNTWWKYNINSGAGIGISKATEDTQTIDPKTGSPLRDKNGIPYAAPIVPAGTVQQQHILYEDAREDQRGLKIAINLAQSFLAILQAVVGGNYGALVGAAKGWYDSFSQKFPEPEDNWRGVVPPTPPVMRRIPSYGFVGSRDDPQPVVPDVSGWTTQSADKLPVLGGGTTVVKMMSTMRGYIFALRRFGAPFSLTPETQIDLEGIRSPVSTLNTNAPRSVTFPAFPKPGFEPGSKEVLETLNAAAIPARRSNGGLLILGFGFASAVVGVLLARRKDINLRPWRRRG